MSLGTEARLAHNKTPSLRDGVLQDAGPQTVGAER